VQVIFPIVPVSLEREEFKDVNEDSDWNGKGIETLKVKDVMTGDV
jgi:hypothetical protein